LSSAATACVEDATGHDTTGKSMDQDKPLLPWAEGNSWTYRVTDGADISTKTTTIGSKGTVGGSGPHASDEAYEVTTLKSNDTDRSVSYQVDIDGKVLRYRELSFSAKTAEPNLDEHWDPYKLHVDGTAEHTVAGADWLEDYLETKQPPNGTAVTAQQRDRWKVDQVPASVTVPAGTFDNAIKLTKAGGDTLKSYWYVRGIGKVKETGGQTEELTEYTVAP
jgi:hypothetical protein